MGVPAETGERCQCHSDGRTRPALLPCRDLLSLGSLETESLHCRHNRPLPVDFNTHPWPAYRHVTDPSYPENLPKRAVGAALAPVLRRCVPLAGQARRLWSFARLKAQCPNLHASVVVLGTPEIHGTLDIALGRGLYLYPELYLETRETGFIVIGDDVVISRGVHLVAYSGISIGDGAMIGEYASIRDANHRIDSESALRHAGHIAKPVSIGSNAWIGRGATVLPGVTIGACAALGRNVGWRFAQGDFILFLDGDTILHPDFIKESLAAMQDPATAVVWGHRRERDPGQSVYVRVLDLDWIYPPGESDFCGGYALMRRDALQDVGGFDDTLIAGEEPEMCRRLRAKGYHILHLDVPMTTHDLAVTRFSAYWRRAFRAGHAYAEVAHRFSHTADPLWSAELKRNLTHGSFLLGAAAASLVLSAIWPWFAALILGLAACAIGRSMRRAAWKSPSRVTRLLYALHSHFQQIPILCGQLTWRLDARCGRRRGLIEYKGAPSA